MRAFDQGCFVRVTVSADEVDAFRRGFPCSGLPPSRGVSFTFDRSNGDLVDLHPEHVDGDGVVALSHDAQAYAERRGMMGDPPCRECALPRSAWEEMGCNLIGGHELGRRR